jgi:hypothetical protein
MNNSVEAFFAWMNPIAGMFTDDSGYDDWRGNFDATKDIFFKTTRDEIQCAYIIRGEMDDSAESDFDIIVLGQWDFIKQTGWHSSDLKEEG